MRSSFILYASWGPMVEAMSNEQAGELLKACYALERDEEIEISDPTVKIVFETVKATMLADREKYIEVSDKRRNAANASKSKKMLANASKCMQMDANDSKSSVCSDLHYESDSESESDNESDKEIKKKPSRAAFVKPTLEELKAYCKERKNNVDPEAFMDFYASKGWKVGSQPMKDWKAAVRTWEKREKPKEKPPDPWKMSNQRNYDYDALENQLLGWGN